MVYIWLRGSYQIFWGKKSGVSDLFIDPDLLPVKHIMLFEYKGYD